MPDYLGKASEVVNGDRQEAYGHPAENFARIATMWSSVLGIPVTREQVALCMILLKASRLINQPTHADSWTDIAGYVATVGLIHGVNDMHDMLNHVDDGTIEKVSEEVAHWVPGVIHKLDKPSGSAGAGIRKALTGNAQ